MDAKVTGTQRAALLHCEFDIVDVEIFEMRHGVVFSGGPRRDCGGLTGQISAAEGDR
jgi:hypothetical protein